MIQEKSDLVVRETALRNKTRRPKRIDATEGLLLRTCPLATSLTLMSWPTLAAVRDTEGHLQPVLLHEKHSPACCVRPNSNSVTFLHLCFQPDHWDMTLNYESKLFSWCHRLINVFICLVSDLSLMEYGSLNINTSRYHFTTFHQVLITIGNRSQCIFFFFGRASNFMEPQS